LSSGLPLRSEQVEKQMETVIAYVPVLADEKDFWKL